MWKRRSPETQFFRDRAQDKEKMREYENILHQIDPRLVALAWANFTKRLANKIDENEARQSLFKELDAAKGRECKNKNILDALSILGKTEDEAVAVGVKQALVYLATDSLELYSLRYNRIDELPDNEPEKMLASLETLATRIHTWNSVKQELIKAMKALRKLWVDHRRYQKFVRGDKNVFSKIDIRFGGEPREIENFQNVFEESVQEITAAVEEYLKSGPESDTQATIQAVTSKIKAMTQYDL